ncbi:hypothetical protein CKO12_12660 [Chromatium okenii]|uniref:hypothetical protein n=1 Tax=Chromatium okenii TaxID=61644 RepID=UPI001903055E|nr:hypothetical protein [Chromatium okenii]MBK1642705.1 hypothetical protein [Chromatium okenii]
MPRDVMLHIDERLDADAQHRLIVLLAERFGITTDIHNSTKPHLLFFSTHPDHAPPHLIIEAVRELGYHAQLVDL